MRPFCGKLWHHLQGWHLWNSQMWPKHQPVTFGLLCTFFLLGLIGLGFAQTLWFIAIRYSSPTLSSAMSSSIPALTFILAIILRMEKLDLRLQSSQVKSIGAIVSISGAFIVTLYKGAPIILIPSSSSPSLDTRDHHSILLHLSASEQSNWVLGGVLLGCCCLLATIWYTSGCVWGCVSYRSSDMGTSQKRACLCYHVQALGDNLCSCARRNFSWRYSAYWKCYWISCNCGWVLWCDVGENSRTEEYGRRKWSTWKLAGIIHTWTKGSSFARKTPTPLTFSIICKLFFLGLIGSSALMFGLTGIDYSSPTLSSAISNLVPAFTFILAIIFRMEKLDLRSIRGQAKSLGAIISITGAFIVTLYKGSPIIIFSPSTHDHQLNLSLSPPKSNWVLGGFFLAIDWLLISIYYIFQASIVKEYPAEQSVVFFYSLFVTIQSAVVTLIIESDLSVWRLRPDIELISIIYSGIFGSVVTGVVHTWAMCKKGPFYVAMFKPMGIVIAVIMGVLFLGDTLHIGSMIGSVIISVGFYGVMWGKADDKEEEKVVAIESNNEANSLDLEYSSSTQRVPLLQNHKVSL